MGFFDKIKAAKDQLANTVKDADFSSLKDKFQGQINAAQEMAKSLGDSVKSAASGIQGVADTSANPPRVSDPIDINTEKGKIQSYVVNVFRNILDKDGLYSKPDGVNNLFVKGYTEKVRPQKIENAIMTFAPGVDYNDVIVYYDASLFGSGKEGFILTHEKFYWNAGKLTGGQGVAELKDGAQFDVKNDFLRINYKNEIWPFLMSSNLHLKILGALLESVFTNVRLNPSLQVAVSQVSVRWNIYNYAKTLVSVNSVHSLMQNLGKVAANCCGTDMQQKSIDEYVFFYNFALEEQANAFIEMAKKTVLANVEDAQILGVEKIPFRFWILDEYMGYFKAVSEQRLDLKKVCGDLTSLQAPYKAEAERQRKLEEERQAKLRRERELEEARIRYEKQAAEAREYVRDHDGEIEYEDGSKYKIVAIGNRVWMAENLRDRFGDYENPNEGNADTDVYGRLYSWSAANESCLQGWHLPTEEDWKDAIAFAKKEYGDDYLSSMMHSKAWVHSETSRRYRGFSKEPSNATGLGLLLSGSVFDHGGGRASWRSYGRYWVRSQSGSWVEFVDIDSYGEGVLKIDSLDLTITKPYFSVRYVKDNAGDKPLPKVYDYYCETEDDRERRCQADREEEERRQASAARCEAERAAEASRRDAEKNARDADLALDARRIQTARIVKNWFACSDVVVTLENDLGETMQVNLGLGYENKPHSFSEHSVSYCVADEHRSYSAQEIAKKYGRKYDGRTNWCKK